MKSVRKTPPRKKKRRGDSPYVLGGMLSVFAFLIATVFSLSVFDHYLLKNSSLAAVISSVLVDLANRDRAAHNVGGLTVSPVLVAAAQAKADDMATKSYFAHVSPEGKDSWHWFKQAGYGFYYAGENLAIDFTDSADVERAWMNSPTHRANVLDEHFTEIGIAIARGTYEGRKTTFVVQMFGTPAISTPAPVKVVSSPIEPTAPALATTVQTPPSDVPAESRVAAATVTPSAQVAPEFAETERVLGTEAGALAPVPSASWWQYLLTSPKTVLRYAYYALAIIILGLLAYVTELEFHKRHMRHVWAAALLFALMTGLFIFANIVLFAAPAVAALP